MVDSVGIKAWITNSQVVHAVAAHPTAKPFEFIRQEVVSPVFAHEPTVSRAPTGEWVRVVTFSIVDDLVPDLPCSNRVTRD